MRNGLDILAINGRGLIEPGFECILKTAAIGISKKVGNLIDAHLLLQVILGQVFAGFDQQQIKSGSVIL